MVFGPVFGICLLLYVFRYFFGKGRNVADPIVGFVNI